MGLLAGGAVIRLIMGVVGLVIFVVTIAAVIYAARWKP